MNPASQLFVPKRANQCCSETTYSIRLARAHRTTWDFCICWIAETRHGENAPQKIKIARSSVKARNFATIVEGDNEPETRHNESLIQATFALTAGYNSCKTEHMSPSNSSPRRTVSIPKSFVRDCDWLFFPPKSPQQSWRQAARRAFAGANSKTASAVVEKASCPARLIFGESP
jgi:hypothetical protein